MVKEQCHAQHAALRHAGEGVDMVQAEGQNDAAQRRHGAAAQRDMFPHSVILLSGQMFLLSYHLRPTGASEGEKAATPPAEEQTGGAAI